MIISLDEFRSNLEKYMRLARILDVYITDGSKQTTWILTSTNGSFRGRNGRVPAMQQLVKRLTASGI